jgi:arginyl-tRNA synthetase
MNYAIDEFEREAREAILATKMASARLIELSSPKSDVPADLAFPTFRLAKELGVPPVQVAGQLLGRLRFGPDSLVGGATVAGPYVNFIVEPARFAAAVLGEVERLGDRYGHDDLGGGRTVVIDYSSPNVAKRMHVGHVRSTIIGQALVNLMSALGYRTVGDNHLGDWGKTFGVLLLGAERDGYPEGDGDALLAALEALYARTTAEAAADPATDEAARAWSLRLERGDPTARELWQRAVDLTVRANQPSYDRLGVGFDHAYGESFYEPMLADVIEDALEKGLAHRNESGAVVIDLGGDLPTFLLQRSDGGTLYHTRDVATIKFRVETFRPAKILYVIGEPQTLYLRQLFALARALGYADGVELVHVAFGTVFDATGQPLSTRRGNMVYLQELLDEAHARARVVVERANPELPAAQKEAIAEAVGVGVVIYNDLHQDPKRNITLDWDRMLAMEGNSAPYVQYMHARCRSILRRAVEPRTDTTRGRIEGDSSVLVHPSEQALVKQLAKLPFATREAGARSAPSEVAAWCNETARTLSVFYRDCRVLDAETAALRLARLRLVEATAQSLKNGLGLLAVGAPDRL